MARCPHVVAKSGHDSFSSAGAEVVVPSVHDTLASAPVDDDFRLVAIAGHTLRLAWPGSSP
uniref:Uncharacterized protein n=1 Tax=Oryza glumipatula TaxID=40148 RepID=A0A0D9ZHF3_9ORYZ